jgi:AbrB family looped-hinge helix DNA binding protein
MLTMKTTIDAAGRLVIPKEVRRQAGLRSGMELEVRWHDGRIEIEPVPQPVNLVQKGRLLVAVPRVAGESLTEKIVEQTRQQLRDERG